MAKWSGKIGFVGQTEVRPGVIKPVSEERQYYGDVTKDYHSWQGNGKINDDISISNQISIVSDFYATQNIGFMKWIEFMGSKWRISSVEVKYPRLVLSIGGLYNEG